MAVSIAYGLLFGTFILLIVLPSGFLALNRVRCAWAQFQGQKPITPERVEPVFRELTEAESLSVRLNGEK
jgi:hypothetical protein